MENAQGFTFHLTGDEIPEDAVEEKSGRFYIKMGFAGFNSHANNRDGYCNRSAALAAVKRYDHGAGRAVGVLR